MAVKYCELDNCWTTEGIWTNIYTTISCSWDTNWLGFQGHKFKGQGHRNVFCQRHAYRSTIRRRLPSSLRLTYFTRRICEIIYLRAICRMERNILQ